MHIQGRCAFDLHPAKPLVSRNQIASSPLFLHTDFAKPERKQSGYTRLPNHHQRWFRSGWPFEQVLRVRMWPHARAHDKLSQEVGEQLRMKERRQLIKKEQGTNVVIVWSPDSTVEKVTRTEWAVEETRTLISFRSRQILRRQVDGVTRNRTCQPNYTYKIVIPTMFKKP